MKLKASGKSDIEEKDKNDYHGTEQRHSHRREGDDRRATLRSEASNEERRKPMDRRNGT